MTLKTNRNPGLIALVMAAVTACLAPATASASGLDRESAADYEAFFTSIFESGPKESQRPGSPGLVNDASGATVAVAKDGFLRYSGGFGVEPEIDEGTGYPRMVDPSTTPFNFGSTGKILTWASVLKLVDDGVLDLDEDVNTYIDFRLPESRIQSQPQSRNVPVTLRTIMTHTAGFAEVYSTLYLAGPEAWRPLSSFLPATLPDQAYPPGRVIAYSNWGTALAGYIVQRAAGMPYEHYLQETFLTPLGMSASQVSNSQERGEVVAALPCAPLHGTIEDLARLLAALLSPATTGTAGLPETSRALLLETAYEHAPGLGGMSLGLMSMELNGRRVLWHLGRTPSYATIIALVPEDGLALAASYNQPPADDGRSLLFAFMDEFYPESTTFPAKLVDPPGLIASTPGPSTFAAPAVNTMDLGWYAPARSAVSGPAQILRYQAALKLVDLNDPIPAIAGNSPQSQARSVIGFGPWSFDASGSAPYPQIDGHRKLHLWEEGGRQWLSTGPLDFYRLRWYESPPALLATMVSGIVLAVFGLVLTLARRRDKLYAGSARFGFCAANTLFWLYTVGAMAFTVEHLVSFGTTFVYPAKAMALASWLFAALPIGAAVLTVSAFGKGRPINKPAGSEQGQRWGHATHSVLELLQALLAVMASAAVWAAGLIG